MRGKHGKADMENCCLAETFLWVWYLFNLSTKSEGFICTYTVIKYNSVLLILQNVFPSIFNIKVATQKLLILMFFKKWYDMTVVKIWSKNI